jgi:hypothetical protein
MNYIKALGIQDCIALEDRSNGKNQEATLIYMYLFCKDEYKVTLGLLPFSVPPCTQPREEIQLN